MADHSPSHSNHRNLQLSPAASQSAELRGRCTNTKRCIDGRHASFDRRSAANHYSAINPNATPAADPRTRTYPIDAHQTSIANHNVNVITNDGFDLTAEIDRQLGGVHHFRQLFGRGDAQYGQTEGANAADEGDAADS